MNCQEFWSTNPELGNPEAGAEAGAEAKPETKPEAGRHLSECPACAARMARHRDLEAGLHAVAAGFRRLQAPPRLEARLRSAFRSHSALDHPARSRRWVPAATWATAFAAMFSLAAFLAWPRQPEAVRPPARRAAELAILQPQTDSDGFVPLPTGPGLAPDEDDVNLVRVEMRRGAMIALGFDVSADRAEELVEADVMLGSDGMARAVRFLN
jgi:anti-sigma factor RsiW